MHVTDSFTPPIYLPIYIPNTAKKVTPFNTKYPLATHRKESTIFKSRPRPPHSSICHPNHPNPDPNFNQDNQNCPNPRGKRHPTSASPTKKKFSDKPLPFPSPPPSSLRLPSPRLVSSGLFSILLSCMLGLDLPPRTSVRTRLV